jgi:hypothetical protein
MHNRDEVGIVEVLISGTQTKHRAIEYLGPINIIGDGAKLWRITDWCPNFEVRDP